MGAEITRLFAVLSLSFRGSLRGPRLMGLTAFAAIPSLLVVVLASARTSPGSLETVAEGLLASLTLPIVVMVVVLVIAVAQFRNEIDAETLVYMSDRSVRRSTVVVGKYLGAWGASLVLALPAALLPLGIIWSLGGTPSNDTVVPVVASAVVLASAAYVGFFLFLGLVSRSALIIGLLFGFLWEELLLLLPGSVPRLTLSFYLRSFLSGELSTGPLSGYSGSVPANVAIAALIGVPPAFLLFAAIAFRYLETAPERRSA